MKIDINPNKYQENFLDFLEAIEDRPIPDEQQERQQRPDGSWWTADTWTIETTRCMLAGKEKYEPTRPKITPLGEIHHSTDVKLSIWELLEKNKDLASGLVVCEVGRGLEILIASLVKKWERIICYDSNWLYGAFLREYFIKKLNLPIEWTCCKSQSFPFGDIGYNDFILIISHLWPASWVDAWQRIRNSSSIKMYIKDGKIGHVDGKNRFIPDD